jgi:hypothetical protein
VSLAVFFFVAMSCLPKQKIHAWNGWFRCYQGRCPIFSSTICHLLLSYFFHYNSRGLLIFYMSNFDKILQSFCSMQHLTVKNHNSVKIRKIL